MILREEEELYKMKKDEQLLKNEIANVQLRIIKEKKTYLAKKRKLQLQILSKQLDTLGRPIVNGADISENGELTTEYYHFYLNQEFPEYLEFVFRLLWLNFHFIHFL